MTPAELAASGAHPWIVNIAFAALAVIGVYATWRKSAREVPEPKPRAEVVIGEAAILDGKPIREGAASLGKAAEHLALCAAELHIVGVALTGLLDIHRRREAADEMSEHETLLRRVFQLEQKLVSEGQTVPPASSSRTRRRSSRKPQA